MYFLAKPSRKRETGCIRHCFYLRRGKLSSAFKEQKNKHGDVGYNANVSPTTGLTNQFDIESFNMDKPRGINFTKINLQKAHVAGRIMIGTQKFHKWKTGDKKTNADIFTQVLENQVVVMIVAILSLTVRKKTIIKSLAECRVCETTEEHFDDVAQGKGQDVIITLLQ
ncbi:hypothetical protein I7I51_00694 [Histoplasma capsulatum]|uniref:Uncharacterized protein n=1 Tax=Ajellomyces capsulatus TaxID=5037 RepID=A0A8A1MCR7_AJECA|nr:hypothetical protein I7I51_00694 [Histoplasma capsulatum]